MLESVPDRYVFEAHAASEPNIVIFVFFQETPVVVAFPPALPRLVRYDVVPVPRTLFIGFVHCVKLET